jgi:hypothetical protein
MEEKRLLERIKSVLEEQKENEVLNDIEQFYKERIEGLKNNVTPRPFAEGGKIILHIIPVESFKVSKHYDLSVSKGRVAITAPLKFHSYSQIYNFEGLLCFSEGADGKCLDYVQVYANGIIEAVEGYHLKPGEKKLYIRGIEEQIIACTKEYSNYQKQLGLNPPVVLYLTLLGTKGFTIEHGSRYKDAYKTYPIEKEDLYLPKIILNRFGFVSEKILKTSFDRIWNACGYPRSLDYDPKGEWVEK